MHKGNLTIVLGIIAIICFYFYIGHEGKQNKAKKVEQKQLVQEKSPEEKKVEMDNLMNESFYLLIVKHGLEEHQLLGLLTDYRKLTGKFIYSTIFLVKRKFETGNFEDAKIVGIPKAIELLSKQYEIPEKRIGEILIDNKLLNFECDCAY